VRLGVARREERTLRGHRGGRVEVELWVWVGAVVVVVVGGLVAIGVVEVVGLDNLVA